MFGALRKPLAVDFDSLFGLKVKKAMKKAHEPKASPEVNQIAPDPFETSAYDALHIPMLTKALKQDEAVRAHHAHRESAAVAKGVVEHPNGIPYKAVSVSKAAITPPVLKDIVAETSLPPLLTEAANQVFPPQSLPVLRVGVYADSNTYYGKLMEAFCGVTEPVEFVHHRLESIVDGVEDRGIHAWIVNIAESEDILALEELERTEHPNTLFLFEAELTHQCIEKFNSFLKECAKKVAQV